MSDSKQKYNWELLKQEFFASDYLEVKAFFQDKYQIYSSHIRDKTNGWTTDKKTFIKSIVSQSAELCKTKKTLEMAEALEKVFEELYRRLSGVDVWSLSIRELKMLWEIFMTMNGETTKVAPRINPMMPERANPDELTQEEREGIERATDYILPKEDE